MCCSMYVVCIAVRGVVVSWWYEPCSAAVLCRPWCVLLSVSFLAVLFD